jgi:hypothetical protein
MVGIYCTHRLNGKMRPVKIIQRMGGGRVKEKDGGGEFHYNIL